MKVRVRDFELRFTHPFSISRETQLTSETVIVELEDGGLTGYGETTPEAYYGQGTAEIIRAIEDAAGLLAGRSLRDMSPKELWAVTDAHFGQLKFAQCGLDIAAYDLWGKINNRPVSDLLGLDVSKPIITDYTIGIDTIDVMAEKMEEFSDWPVFKIKLGTDRDIDIIRALRERTDAIFRVDANCAWGVEETIRNSVAMKDLGVEFIEQPMPVENQKGMKEVFGKSALPLMADESCVVEGDVERCAGYFHGVNIKLTKCGGMTPALRMIEKARELGLELMVGCMGESTIGISAIAHLAPLLDYVDMDTTLLLADDLADGLTFERGRAIYTGQSGLGFKTTY